MSRARRIVPGSTYLITRRCAGRQFLLAPSPAMMGVLLYCLAWAARLVGVEVHVFLSMSTHYHALVSDPLGLLPRCLQWFHLHVAKCGNVLLERGENFWACGSYSAVRLPDRDAVLRKIAYVLCNPIEAGLVKDLREYPHVFTKIAQLGDGVLTVSRPAVFFRQEGPSALPAQLELRLTVPPAFAGTSPDEFRRLVRAEVASRAKRLRAERAATGKGYAGAAAVRAMVSTPTRTSGPTRPTRDLDPAFAGRGDAGREAAEEEVTFRLAYASAWRRYQDAPEDEKRDVVFPYGTYWMVHCHQVRCASPP